MTAPTMLAWIKFAIGKTNQATADSAAMARNCGSRPGQYNCRMTGGGCRINERYSTASAAPTDSYFTRTLDAVSVHCNVWLRHGPNFAVLDSVLAYHVSIVPCPARHAVFTQARQRERVARVDRVPERAIPPVGRAVQMVLTNRQYAKVR